MFPGTLRETAKALCNLIFISEQHVPMTQLREAAWKRSQGFCSPLLETEQRPLSLPWSEGHPGPCPTQGKAAEAQPVAERWSNEACSGGPGLPQNRKTVVCVDRTICTPTLPERENYPQRKNNRSPPLLQMPESPTSPAMYSRGGLS